MIGYFYTVQKTVKNAYKFKDKSPSNEQLYRRGVQG